MSPNQEQVEQGSVTIEELQLQHQDHERRLEELRSRAYLTPDEEMEEKRLKKQYFAKFIKVFLVVLYEQAGALNSKYGSDESQKVTC